MQNLSIPKLMPDEMLIWYFERLARSNGYENGARFIVAIKRLVPELTSLNSIQIASRLLGVSAKDIAYGHTQIPFYRSITNFQVHVEHGDESHPSLMRLGMTIKTGKANICAECIHEDLGYWGFAYLRRSHQIPGNEWCQKHQRGLISIQKDTLSADADIFHATHLADHSSSHPHPVINRYIQIAESLSYRKAPLLADKVSKVLSERAKQAGVMFNASGSGRPLSDLLLEQIPNVWLHEHFPVFQEKQKGKFLAALDGVCVFRFQNHKPSHYMLAAAMLFDHADDAVNAFISESTSNLPKKRALVKREAEFWTSPEFLDTYVKHRGNVRWISDEIGGHYDTTRVNLSKYGLPPIQGFSRTMTQALLDFSKGKPLSQIIASADFDIDRFGNIIQTAHHQFYIALETIQNMPEPPPIKETFSDPATTLEEACPHKQPSYSLIHSESL